MFWLKKYKQINPFELGVSVSVYYLLIFYSLPILAFLSVPLRFTVGNYRTYPLALFYLSLGLLSFLLAYFIPLPRKIFSRVHPFFSAEWDPRRAAYIWIVLVFAGVLVKIFRIFGGAYFHLGKAGFITSSAFYSILGLFDWFGSIALVIAFAMYFSLKRHGDERAAYWKFFAWGTWVFEMAYAIPTCSRMAIVTPIVLYLLVRTFLVGVEYGRLVLWGVLVALVIFPAGNMCRNANLLESYRIRGEDSITFAAASDVVAGSFLSRIDQSTIFAKIVTLKHSPTYGESLLNFFISLGPPRFIWKSKPVINGGGNEFGHELGLVAPGDTSTSIGPTIVGDWFMNFGGWGVVVGMFFMGILFRIVHGYLIIASNISLSGVLFYSFIWLHVIKGMEDWIAPVYAGLVKLLVILAFIIYFLGSRKASFGTT